MFLGASTSTAVTPLSRDVVQISTRAAPACGRTGAREVAYRSAAIETLRQGYDGFFVVGLAGRSNPVVIGRTPVTTRGTFNVSGSHVSGTTTSFGGAPIVASAREEDVTIQMVGASEPAYRDAIDARSVLGEEWEAIVERGIRTCFGQ